MAAAADSRSIAVWALTTGIALLAVGLHLWWLAGLRPASPGLHLPWWSLAVLFAIAESCVAHVEFRREAHSFSLSEIVFTVGLFLSDPSIVVVSCLLGSALALGLVRRQRPIRLAFNLATFAAGGSLAVGIFAQLDGATAAWPMDWIATFLAVGVWQLFTTVAVSGVISVVEREWSLTRLRQIVVVGLSTAFVNTSLGLLVVSSARRDVRETVLLVLPSVMLLVAYRAYTGQRRKHESLGLLSDVSRVLGQAPTTDAGITALLRRTREALRCEHAELVLFPMSPSEPFLVATVSTDEEVTLRPAVDEQRHALVAGLVARGDSVMLNRRSAGERLHGYVEAYDCKDAILAPIRGETRIIGALVVRDRMAQPIGFSDADRALFEMLANHASATLENGRLERSLARVTELQRELRHQAYHDVLTQLPNRLRFTEAVENALRHPRLGRLPAVLFVDLDDFKAVNDTLGHAAGDELLSHAAARLRGCLRSGDLVARLGGDEFAVLLQHGDPAAADTFAGRIIAAMRRPFTLREGDASVSASIGIAHTTDDATDSQALLRNADLALYEAKALGKNRHAVFQPVLHQAVLERQRVREEIGRALEHHDFVVHYQPYVELGSGRVIGAEALLRWRRCDGTLSGPDTFIPIAEESGLIVDLGRQVLRQACGQAAVWQTAHPGAHLSVSVNVSAGQLQHPGLYDDVRGALQDARLAPERLVLEITESTLLHDIDATMRRLSQLSALGVRVAIDDFGTGYSSLSYLRRLPVDILKLDKTFVDDIAVDVDASAMTNAIVGLADSLHVQLVAEGIENAAQRSVLQAMGCRYGQGYHFGHPVQPDELHQVLDLAVLPDESPVPSGWSPTGR